MNFLQGKKEILGLYLFLDISLNLYVFHVTHLIVGNLNFHEKGMLLHFLKISMCQHHLRKK